MRTTLDIADDVLFAAKELARREKKSIGEIISDLARQSFARAAMAQGGSSPGETKATVASEQLATYGIRPLPKRGAVISNELIDRLRDQEGV